ncbi:MAG TPA: hypothetical protein VFS15_22795 [Kofleriaceae bacterium]|nr:hypothetical protein [Kofleriaceae bacterium]
MRTIVLTIALMVSGCAPGLASGTSTDRVPACGDLDECVGGSGEADGIVTVAVASTIVGALAYAAYRRLAR